MFIYDIMGKPMKPFNFPQEVCSTGLLQCAIWGSGVAVLTKNMEVYIASDFEKPFIEKLADTSTFCTCNSLFLELPPPLDDDIEISMEAAAPEISQSGEVEVYIGPPAPSKSLLVVTSQDCTNMV